MTGCSCKIDVIQKVCLTTIAKGTSSYSLFLLFVSIIKYQCLLVVAGVVIVACTACLSERSKAANCHVRSIETRISTSYRAILGGRVNSRKSRSVKWKSRSNLCHVARLQVGGACSESPRGLRRKLLAPQL